MADLRIALIGQQAFGKAVLEALLERGEDVIAVYCAPDREGRPPDPLKEAALAHRVPLLQPPSYKEAAVADAFREMRPDLAVMAFVTLFVPEDFLYVPSRGTIQYHPSLLPRHRGPSSINWPIIQGETRTGLTVFWPDNGLDTGPILLQREVEIGENDTVGSVYFDKLFPLGVEAMLEAVDLVRDGTAPKIVQDESKATYESWCRADDVAIDWLRPAPELHNLIRGADPSPGAWTTLDGQRIALFGARREDAASGAPGEILEAGSNGLVIAAAGGAVRVERVRPEGGAKVTAAEFAAGAGLAPGRRLG